MRVLEGVLAFAIGTLLAWMIGCGSASDYDDEERPRPDFPFHVVAAGVDEDTINVTVVGASHPDSIKATTNAGTGTSDNGSVNVDVDEDTHVVNIHFVTWRGSFHKRMPRKT